VTAPGPSSHRRETIPQHLLPPEDLAEELEVLRCELLAERERHLRVLADFSNYRRRIERDRKKLDAAARRELILPLLEVVDDTEKALQWAEHQQQPVVEGVRHILQKMLAMLEARGVRPFVSVGKPFDHNIHDAVAVDSRSGIEPGMVIDELRRGYFMDDDLLRPAQVRVSARG
jgi:molecular chaperone GrpE